MEVIRVRCESCFYQNTCTERSNYEIITNDIDEYIKNKHVNKNSEYLSLVISMNCRRHQWKTNRYESPSINRELEGY